MTWRIIEGEALAVMATLPEQSVDAIITDLPYGTTACKWDVIIPFAPMWAAVKRVLKPRGAFVTTASQPFTSALAMSNPAWFRYEWIWDKIAKCGHLNAKVMPLRRHEDIAVFAPATLGNFTYNPQMTKGVYRQKGGTGKNGDCYGAHGVKVVFNDDYYPSSILTLTNGGHFDKVHPTQKPVALYAYLIRTYTNEGDTVLDFCAGSGTTLVAAIETGRHSIGCDTSAEYVEIARRRCEQAEMQGRLL